MYIISKDTENAIIINKCHWEGGVMAFTLNDAGEIETSMVLGSDTKLYIPSTLNIALLQWHTHLNVCAVK